MARKSYAPKSMGLFMRIDECPREFRELLDGAVISDRSGHSSAETLKIIKGGRALYLKSAEAGTLWKEAAQTRFFHSKGLAAEVLSYVNDGRDWLLTAEVSGRDCTSREFLEQPERLSELLGKKLRELHSLDFAGCPVIDWVGDFLSGAEENYARGTYNKEHFPDSYGYASAEDAYRVIRERGHTLEANALIHGDYCLPNVILDDWEFSGFIDLGGGGVGDRHSDIFWGAWSLWYNLGTDAYRERFFDAYGRDFIDMERLEVIAAAEVFY